jgi:hypothetical protein
VINCTHNEADKEENQESENLSKLTKLKHQGSDLPKIYMEVPHNVCKKFMRALWPQQADGSILRRE